jgi:rhodanese-related sulfurtransferase
MRAAGQRSDKQPNIPSVTVREAQARLTQPDGDATLIDVREPWEYVEVRAQSAKNIPLSELIRRVGEIPRDKDVLLICHTGQRSLSAAAYLQRQGIARVFNVEGGTEEWEQAGLPVERG